MDVNSQDQQTPEPKTCAVGYSENASFILGTGKLVTPPKHVAEATPPSLCNPDTFKSPLNFSTVTVEQLGITPESFVKNSSGKSPSHLKKSRRRSAVGARGSPETNHLIRFIAQHRNLKTPERSPLAHNFPYQGSPGLYRNGNSFRERISAFRAAFHSIQETENMADCSEADRRSKTSGLTKKEGVIEYQQSKLSSKRRRLSSQTSSDEHLSIAGGSVDVPIRTDVGRACAVGATAHLTEKSSELASALTGSIVAESAPPSERTETSSALVSSETIPDVTSPATPVCRNNISSPETFVLRSVLKKPTGKLLSESVQEHHNNVCDGGTHPSLISNCKEQKPDQENVKALAFVNVRKRKRVTFGEDLSPELFDESLPANTPLRKGGTPVRPKDSSDTSPLLLQPDFDDKVENLENIEPLQVSFAVLSPNKASISETLSGTDTFTSSNNHEKIASCKVDRPTRTSSRRKQLMGFTEEHSGNSHNTEVKPSKVKKTNRMRSQETKCRNRALPKKKQVSNSCRKKKGKGKKDFQKSLYGERDIASKKPLLSPIPELPELSETTPLVPGIRRFYADDFHSSGKVAEVNHPKISEKRKKIWSQNSEDSPTHPLLDGLAKSQVCSWLPGSVASRGGADIHHMDNEDHGSSPRAESQLESVKEPKPESSHLPGASVVEELVSHHPEPACNLQGWEFTDAGQHAEKLCGGLHNSEEGDEKCEKDGEFSVTVEEKLACSHLISDSEKELDCLEDVLIGNTKAPTRLRENMRRKSTESGCSVSDKARKHRRRSVCYSDSQSLRLEQNWNHTPSCSVESSVEVSLESSELYKDLSDGIEQSFQRTDRETKVRRSTRLQGGIESQGLVWISLPAPSTSQKTKRRTISAFDNREFESMSPRKETVPSTQKAIAFPSVSGSEAAGSTRAPGKRRKSFCASTPLHALNAAQPVSFWRASEEEGGKLSAALRARNKELKQ